MIAEDDPFGFPTSILENPVVVELIGHNDCFEILITAEAEEAIINLFCSYDGVTVYIFDNAAIFWTPPNIETI